MREPPTHLTGGAFLGGALLTFAQAPATSGTWQGHLLRDRHCPAFAQP